MTSAESANQRKQRPLIFGLTLLVLASSIYFSASRTTSMGGVTQSNLGRMAGTAYGLYYWNLFPLVIKSVSESLPYDLHSTRISPPLDPTLFTPEGSRQLLARLRADPDPREVDVLHGPEDLGITYLIALKAWLTGKFLPLSIVPLNLFFLVALQLCLLRSFCQIGRPWLGLITVGFLSFHPLVRLHLWLENISIYPYFGFLWMLATAIPFIFNYPLGFTRIIGRLSVGILGLIFFTEVRGSTLICLGGLSIAMSLYAPQRLSRNRIFLNLAAAVAILVGFFLGQGFLRHRVADWQSQSAKSVGITNIVSTEGKLDAHSIVHPLWCGLGDFGKTHGFYWSDRAAFDYALAKNSIFSESLPEKERDRFGQVFRKRYTLGLVDGFPDVFNHSQEYSQVLRQSIFAAIKADPLWYLGVIGQRLIAVSNYGGAGNKILVAALFLLFLYVTDSPNAPLYLRLFLVSSVFILQPLLIFSSGFENYFVAPYVVCAVLLFEIASGVKVLLGRVVGSRDARSDQPA